MIVVIVVHCELNEIQFDMITSKRLDDSNE